MSESNGHLPLAPGVALDGFRVEERLHQGGMATVWRATRADLPFPVAVKVPRVGNTDDPAAVVAFETERMILPKLSGPYVPRFIAAGDFEECPYLAMEYVPGPVLEERLAAAPLDAAEVADIGARVADALHDLHRQHVSHLDLAPDNIVFRPGGEAVLLDFGLARHERLPDLLAEAFQGPLGTAGYIAPEQVLGVRDEPRSDLFALGAILYTLATGRLPFGEPESPRGLRRRLTRKPVPPRGIAPECPPWLQEIILRCLEVDPRLRHESAAQLAFDLRNPEDVTLTERAGRLGGRGLLAGAARQVRDVLALFTQTRPAARGAARVRRAHQLPIVMAAVDVAHGSEALAEALRIAALGALELDPDARLTCVTVHRVAPGRRLNIAEGGRAVHVQRLVELKHWARTLELAPGRLSFHVLDAVDPAGALIEFARTNHVDHIVIGARGSSALRRHLGSVSSAVAAMAPCTVTVVRTPHECPAGPVIIPETREGGL
jgi:nucleotide-binding universal stress UspA family protein